MDNRKQRQHSTTGSKLIVVGCGGIGWWAAIAAAMFGIGRIVLIDHDSIDASNCNRLPVLPRNVGRAKTAVLAAQLRALRPQCHVTRVHMRIDSEQQMALKLLLQDPSLEGARVLDCTDDLRVQRLVEAVVRDVSHIHGYCKAGYEGLQIGLYSTMSSAWEADGYTRGYATAQSNVLTSMVAGALAVLRCFETAQVVPTVNLNMRKLVGVITEGGEA